MTTHEINIYGDIVPFKWYDDGTEFDIESLNSALNSINPESGDEVMVNIHTLGGCTTTAFAIYNKLLNYKTRNGVSLSTRADGYCASSGVIILLAGDKRIGNQYAEPFIHNAWCYTVGNREEHKKTADLLDRVDSQIASLYAERTNISREEALQLMAQDSFVSADEALKYGFYTEFENVYAPENSIVMNSIRSRNAEQRTKKRHYMNKTEKEKKDFFKRVENFLFGEGPKNKILYTAENNELDFFELGEDDTPKIGDKARFDGKPAGESNGGEYLMQNGDTFRFSGEELTEIVEKTDETIEELENIKAENAANVRKIQELKKEIENLKAENLSVSNRLNEATELVKTYQNFAKPIDEDKPRETKKEEGRSEIRGAFLNLKK
ncbi:ATP-dependent protease ClpP, protease subunit [Cruoricaptor ignavus]|uniref:ATP-dependent protease ClpP, protease subunit n=1 Tax=Cruoricaptor ignavus TaxID=1118202 RepID=A0A1M6HDZ6_9FLAO|nr:Clp protease ClpP [Cruoricaptor ignavus]SHJ20346.1 ATP-dependent protease ClpP, protease subunit [Cruoricaptor ignavus]